MISRGGESTSFTRSEEPVDYTRSQAASISSHSKWFVMAVQKGFVRSNNDTQRARICEPFEMESITAVVVGANCFFFTPSAIVIPTREGSSTTYYAHLGFPVITV